MDRHRRSPTLAAWVAMLFVAFTTAAAADGPPAVNFDAIAKSPVDRLSPEQVKGLTARVDFWLQQLSQTKDPQEVQAAREGLLADYKAVDKSFYQSRVAALAGERALAVLTALPAEWKSLKEVNIALALSQMPQVAIREALEKLIVADNPGVRYCGWVGYRNIRTLVLAFPAGSTFEKQMYQSLRDQAEKEPSGPVVTVIIQMLQMTPVVPTGVSRQAFEQFQQTAYDILQSVWTKRCREVMAGDAGMAEACRKAVSVVERFSLVFPGDAARKKQMLQMVLDMAWCSAKAYGNLTEAAKEEAAKVREANGSLLRECESSLASLSGTRANYISQRLAESGPTVGLAVLDWAKALKDQGVVSPEDRFAAPASAPASAPAAPATKPGT